MILPRQPCGDLTALISYPPAALMSLVYRINYIILASRKRQPGDQSSGLLVGPPWTLERTAECRHSFLQNFRRLLEDFRGMQICIAFHNDQRGQAATSRRF